MNYPEYQQYAMVPAVFCAAAACMAPSMRSLARYISHLSQVNSTLPLPWPPGM